MIGNSALEKIAEREGWREWSCNPLSGGDINEVFKVEVNTEVFVVKINAANKYPHMFEAEAEGLKALRNAEVLRVPQVVSHGEIADIGYLVMEYLPSGGAEKDFWSQFGRKLAELHKNSSETFGFTMDNYIGSLPQYNKSYKSASEFYINMRLEPQFKMAFDKGFQFQKIERLYKNISEEIPEEHPSLIHGDLWSGNFLISKDSEPILIDPAVAYAPREMDIAMMRLFGGFDSEIFSVYHENFPLQDDWKKRMDLWQLYYLLVHLNIFGAGYFGRVKNITTKYS